MKNKICPICNKQFNGRNKYCSKICSIKGIKKSKKGCTPWNKGINPNKRRDKLIYLKKWQELNKEHRNAVRYTPKGIYRTMKNNAKTRRLHKLEDFLSLKDFADWYVCQEKKCIYCGILETDLEKHPYGRIKVKRLTIDRISNDKEYQLRNIGLCYIQCNMVKGDRFTPEQMKVIGLIIAGNRK